jgi:hypothetical protein
MGHWFAFRQAADARGMPASAAGWVPGLYSYAFGHATGYGKVPCVGVLEREGWVRLGELSGLVGFYVMRRDRKEAGD